MTKNANNILLIGFSLLLFNSFWVVCLFLKHFFEVFFFLVSFSTSFWIWQLSCCWTTVSCYCFMLELNEEDGGEHRRNYRRVDSTVLLSLRVIISLAVKFDRLNWAESALNQNLSSFFAVPTSYDVISPFFSNK